MEHRKYSKVSPKKVKAWSQNNRKSMSGPPFWRAFEPGSLPRDALETMLGWNPEKPQKNHFFGTLFSDHFWTNLNVFLWRFFVMFSKPHFCQLSGLKGTHLHQFEAHLGTKLMTFPINLEKWQLRFRSRGDMEIKLFRVCISRLFIIFWYVLSKPVIATLHRRHYSHYAQFMDPFGLHSRLNFAICCTSFFLRFFDQIFFF